MPITKNAARLPGAARSRPRAPGHAVRGAHGAAGPPGARPNVPPGLDLHPAGGAPGGARCRRQPRDRRPGPRLRAQPDLPAGRAGRAGPRGGVFRGRGRGILGADLGERHLHRLRPRRRLLVSIGHPARRQRRRAGVCPRRCRTSSSISRRCRGTWSPRSTRSPAPSPRRPASRSLGAIAVVNVENPYLGVSGLTGQIINQTDGTTTPAQIVQTGTDTWDVYDPEPFEDPGTNDVTIDLGDQQGDTFQLQGEVSVTVPPSGARRLPSPSLRRRPTRRVRSRNSRCRSRTSARPRRSISRIRGAKFESIDRGGGGAAGQRSRRGDQFHAACGGRRGGFRAAHARRQGAARRHRDRELHHRAEAQPRRARRDPAGAAARWLGSVVRDTVHTLSDNNAAEAAGRQVVRNLFARATGPFGASKPSGGVGHIIKPVARAGTAALEGGLEKAAIRYFASHGEKILRSQIGRSSRGIDIASYVGQGTGARLIITESQERGRHRLRGVPDGPRFREAGSRPRQPQASESRTSRPSDGASRTECRTRRRARRSWTNSIRTRRRDPSCDSSATRQRAPSSMSRPSRKSCGMSAAW